MPTETPLQPMTPSEYWLMLQGLLKSHGVALQPMRDTHCARATKAVDGQLMEALPRVTPEQLKESTVQGMYRLADTLAAAFAASKRHLGDTVVIKSPPEAL